MKNPVMQWRRVLAGISAAAVMITTMFVPIQADDFSSPQSSEPVQVSDSSSSASASNYSFDAYSDTDPSDPVSFSSQDTESFDAHADAGSALSKTRPDSALENEKDADPSDPYDAEEDSQDQNASDPASVHALQKIETFSDDTAMNTALDDTGENVDSLQPYITSGQICYKSGEDSDWTPVKPNEQGVVNVPEGASYRITLNYQLPEGTLSTDHHILTYQLPDGIKVYPDSGSILEGSNLMGTYQITEDGQVTLDFNDQAIESNACAPFEHGLIRYRIDLQKTVDDSGSRDVPYEINGEKMTIHLKLVPSLDIQKTASAAGEVKEIDYTITVSSSHGTDGEPVTVEDTRLPGSDGSISLGEARDLQVYDPNGQLIEGWHLEKTKDGFKISGLPALNAGQQYTIKYKAKLIVTNGAEVTAINQAQASSGSVTTEPCECKYSYTPKHLLQKSGRLTGQDKIDWTIEINKDHDDIGGWKLEDALDDVSQTGPFTIDPPVQTDHGLKDTIDLPFTFPKGDTNTYTLTYETSVEYDNGNDYTTNSAALTPPNGGSPAVASATVHFKPDGNANQVEKTLASAQSGPDATEILTWNLNIIPGKNGFKDYFSLTDLCSQYDTSDKMYFTGEQLSALLNSLLPTLKEHGISIVSIDVYRLDHDQALSPDQIEKEGKYSGFMLYGSGNLRSEESLNFTYQTTVKLHNLTWTSTFVNSVAVASADGLIERKAAWHWENSIPVITKVDTRNPGDFHTYHNYEQTDGLLKWSIRTKVPAGFTDRTMTIKDLLPDGLNVEHGPNGETISDPLSLTLPDGTTFSIPIDGTPAHGLQANVVHEDNGKEIIEILFTQAFFDEYPGLKAGNEQFEINVVAGLDKKPEWKYENGKASMTFVNHADVYSEDGTELNKVSQMQTIQSKAPISRLSKALDTSDCDDTCFENNILPYSITVNPKGEKLGADGEDLTVTDSCRLAVEGNDPITLELINGSLNVCKIGPDGTLTPLDSNQYKYKVESKNEGNGQMEYRIVFTLPDGIPIKISYSYLVNGNMNAECTITNQASMNSASQGHMDDHTRHKVTVCSSSATVESIGVTLYKTADDNTGITLPGAQFELLKYNSATGKFETVCSNQTGQAVVFETGADGSVTITSPYIDFGIAYELKEIKAPEHYAITDDLYKFLVVENSTKAVTAPEGFVDQAQVFHISGNIYIGNKRTVEDIHVTKKWVDQQGNAAQPPVDQIKAELYHLENGKEISDGILTLGKDNNWQASLSSLPVYATVTKDGQKVPDLDQPINYYLRELDESQAKDETSSPIAWDWKASQDPADKTSFTLTNTVFPKPVSLPKTGSQTWLPILAIAGGAFTLAFISCSDPSSQARSGRKKS